MKHVKLISIKQLDTLVRDLFLCIIKASQSTEKRIFLSVVFIDTPLGDMVAIANEEELFLLEFLERKKLEKELNTLQQQLKAAFLLGETRIIKMIVKELSCYFQDKQFSFKTPCHMLGTSFQERVWRALQTIPAGQTRSYADIAKLLNQPKAFRAVARANATNHLAIIVPCHRVINSDGGLGGYAAGVERKQYLLKHEGVLET